MKVSFVVVASLVLGAVLGASLSWARFGNVPPFQLPESHATENVPGEGPRIWIDEERFDFGAIQRDIEVRHVFDVKNIGTRALTLNAAGTSCSKCTIVDLEKDKLEPNETARVIVAYKPGDQASFRQMAWFRTNDPDHQRVELTVSGRVTTRYEVVPGELVFSKISANEAHTADVKIVAYFSDTVEVAEHSFADPGTGQFFEVKTTPLDAATVEEHHAKSGCQVEVTVKPGLPLGPIRQTIRLQLRMSGAEDIPTVEVPISGTIDSDISIVGPDWNSGYGRLTIGAVNASEGATRRLLVLVRGPRRHDVQITVGKLDPSWLKVTLGEPSDLAGGAVTQIPLTIEIPPNSPAENRLGTDQGKFAEVTLETTHPDVKQIRMNLKFVIVR